jgi:hypothetical protein
LTDFGLNCDMCTVLCCVTCHNLTDFGLNCDMCTDALCGVVSHVTI